MAGQALRILDLDRPCDVQRAVDAVAVHAAQFLLRAAGTELFDQLRLPLAGLVARVGRIEHGFLVFVSCIAVAQAVQGLGRREGRHGLRQERLRVERIQMRLDLLGRVAANRQRGIHQHLRVVAHFVERVLLQVTAIENAGADDAERKHDDQHQIELEA